jgi:hypothetical protein
MDLWFGNLGCRMFKRDWMQWCGDLDVPEVQTGMVLREEVPASRLEGA